MPRITGDALMHYIEAGEVERVVPCQLPPDPITNPADGACQIYCDVDDTGAPIDYGCIQGSCTTTCTQQVVPGTGPNGEVADIHYCGCA